jgi:hypothetical protein
VSPDLVFIIASVMLFIPIDGTCNDAAKVTKGITKNATADKRNNIFLFTIFPIEKTPSDLYYNNLIQ